MNKEGNKKNKQGYIQKKATPFRGAIITLFILLFISASIIVFIFIFNSSFKGKAFPGTYIGDLYIGGQTYEEIAEVFREQANKQLDKGFSFTFRDNTFVIPSTIGDSVNPELSTELAVFDVEATIKRLEYMSGKQTEAEHIFYWITKQQLIPAYSVNETAFEDALREVVGEHEEPAIDAELVIAEDFSISVTAEKSGKAFQYDAIIDAVGENLKAFKSTTVLITLEREYPDITRDSSANAVLLVEQAFASAPYVLMYDEYAWAITKEHLRDYLEFQFIDRSTTIGISNKKAADFIQVIVDEIDIPVQEARFSMENGKVLEFSPSRIGRSVEASDTLARVSEQIRKVGIKEIDIIVTEVQPEVTTDDVNDIGIRELIGEGHSDFSGSPSNRRHNIAVGADTLNGILIKPGEEFSLIGALGEIEKSTGYLPELVIKGNKTIPEYGGGLCQIGTTTFRAALDAGFPITERRNHSYRVSYYEPAGTDATIYDPKPDFRFVNDTENYILLTTEISGSDLYFRFYGTSDGRSVEQTAPRIFNYVSPGPTKLVETTDLAPGQKKCTERAHTGADAEFTRTITSANGETTVDTFTSHYKPWQEVCLIGVEELSEEAE